MSQVADLVEAFKREVAIPGTFGDVFPDTSDEDIAGTLADAFAQAQLDGFFGTVTLDPATGTITPDLSVAGAALVVIYAGMRMVRSQIRNQATLTRYKAGSVEYEVGYGTSALVEELKALETRRKELINAATRAMRSGSGSTFVIDGYVARALYGYGAFYGYEFALPPAGIGADEWH